MRAYPLYTSYHCWLVKALSHWRLVSSVRVHLYFFPDDKHRTVQVKPHDVGILAKAHVTVALPTHCKVLHHTSPATVNVLRQLSQRRDGVVARACELNTCRVWGLEYREKTQYC